MNNSELTPKQIVAELDKYIVGQDKAKRAVAVALRNRFRRRRLSDDLRDEVIPKNILMMGPTGVGKTEIARRLANLAGAPFVKVEATKFTEVGYVGRDVDSMVRDLVQRAVSLVETEKVEEVRPIAEQRALDRILDILEPPARHLIPGGAVPKQWFDSIQNAMGHMFPGTGAGPPTPDEESPEVIEEEVAAPSEEYTQDQIDRKDRIRSRLHAQLIAGELDEREITIEIEDTGMPHFQVFGQQGLEEMGMDMSGMLGNLFPKRTKRKQVTVREAKTMLAEQEAHSMIDQDSLTREAIDRAEQDGIIFVDEMDKIAGREKEGGPQVSREGVQRDILPIIEGSTVMTKFGPVSTNHILFIAAGAFHVAKPSDLIPELQGRLPIRVELDSLTESDFIQILTEPQNALTKQYTALLATEGVAVDFTTDGIAEIAKIAAEVNTSMENIGARRLHTIMERLLDDLSFAVPSADIDKVTIDAAYVQDKLADIVKDEDLSRYIL
ncbi:MAG: ATP-dependent protease ATPase subunit HslU [Armatimonadetes bacterium]|nr:ATP-dependent protease ATPase subunit HslU [Armatimonadota bacterium]